MSPTGATVAPLYFFVIYFFKIDILAVSIDVCALTDKTETLKKTKKLSLA